MHCSRCQAENSPGSRFCGTCGAPIDEPPPRVTAPTSQMPAGGLAQPELPPLARDGRPEIFDDGSGASLRVPVSRGARLVTVLLVVLLDVAMAVTGIVLLTRSRDAPSPTTTDAAPPIAIPADGGELIGDGVAIGGDTKVSRPRPRPDPRPEPDPRPDPKPDPKPDAKPDPRPDPKPDAKPDSKPDAGLGPGPGPGPDPDPDPEPDPGPDPDSSAEAIPDQVAVHMARSQSRLSRCYSQATKGLPDDQPLEGEVDIAFEVMPTGGTRNVSVARNTTGSNTLAACISDTVAGWTFDPFVGAAVDVIRTFRFRPSG